MKKVILLFCLAVFILPAIYALDLNVTTKHTNVVLINNVNEPAVFNLQVTNNGMPDNLQFYNLLGFNMFPEAVPLSWVKL